MNIKIAFLSFFFFIPFCIFSSEIITRETLKGIVLDAQTNEPIPYASIFLTENNYGVITNEKGEFVLNTNKFTQMKSKVKVSCVGFKPVLVALTKNDTEIIIKLSSEVQVLHEVTVNKQKYRNRNNLAVELI